MSQRHRNWVYTSTEHKEEIKPIETCLHVRAEVHQGTRKQVSLMITHTDAIHQFTRWLPIQVSVKELRCVLCFISTQWWYTISMVAGIYRTYHLSNKQATNWPVAISDAELTLLDFFCHSWRSLCQINWHGVMVSCHVLCPLGPVEGPHYEITAWPHSSSERQDKKKTVQAAGNCSAMGHKCRSAPELGSARTSARLIKCSSTYTLSAVRLRFFSV